MTQRIVAIDARLIGQANTGDTSYWTGLVQGLMQLDTETRFLLFSNVERPPEIPDHPKFQWVELHSSRARWWSLIRFPLAARRMRAKAFHVQYNLSPLVFKGGITTVHDVSFYSDPTWFKPRDRVLLQRFVPPSCRRASRVITVSEFSKREISHYISGLDGKVRVTPNACGDDVHLVPRDQAADRVKAELGIDGPFLLAVGTRWPRKNLQLAMNAARLLPAAVPHRLALTGKAGWGEETLNSRVVPTGYVSRDLLNALYSAADLYLAPALYEGFGITLLEAFRCGCPVMASPIEAHREAGGDAPLYARDWTPETWALQIQEILAMDSSKIEAVRQSGYAQNGTFSWRDTAQLTDNIYREVCDGERP